ncbi:MAG: long-chain fatty acid--CoA ligase [Acidobacteria bacterium]|nr:long-chain fatty acid--CoA ligase [Acidobacteriota bacterium]
MTERTILDLYHNDVQRPRERHYTHYFPGGSRALSTDEFASRTAALAEGLTGLGVRRGDRVLLLSENRPEWHMVDLAVLDVRATDVPVYTTLTPQQIAYQAQDSGALVAVGETAEHIRRFQQIRGQCPELRHLVQIEGEADEGVLTLDDLVSTASSDATDRFWERAAEVREDELASIVYTSGTTGEPKGVMLTHQNFVSNVKAVMPRIPMDHNDLGLEFLPLCHVFERTVAYAYMYVSAFVAYCATKDVAELVAAVAPTTFASVPRLYEKIYTAINSKVAAAPPIRRSLFHWAAGVGWEAAQRRLAGRSLGPGLGLRHSLADKLVLSKVRQALGGRLRFSISGGAPLPLYVNEFFHSIGLPIQEGYGLTETSPAIGIAGFKPGDNRLGSIGRGLENLEIKLGPDGELLVKGPSITQGYWNKPEQTAEVLDAEGFFHTGDIARMDEDGFIFITDRKKDLIVTAGGKNVAPQPIEAALKKSALVDNALLIGDRRPFIIALLSPSDEELTAWAHQHNLEAGDLSGLLALPQVATAFEQVVAEVNADLARYEQIRKFAVLPRTLTIEEGDLTPTMKIKRRVVENEFADLINELYGGAAVE